MPKKILLGSKSPRRKLLIESVYSCPIDIIAADTDEIYPDNLPHSDIPQYLAKLKSDNILKTLRLDDELLITADTMVMLDNKIMGKPKDIEEAKRMLLELSGNRHKVITGVCVVNAAKTILFDEHTEVYFHHLTTKDIDFYIKNYEVMDKAGSYGIQDFIGYIGIQKINGCYYNVMGLPISKLYQEILTLQSL